MRRVLACLLALLGAVPTAHAQDTTFYDVAPLLAHVRAEQRGDLAERLEVSSLDQVPLYDLALTLDDQLRGFGLRETIFVTNTERRPWNEVVLRVFANATGASGEAPPITLSASECLDGLRCVVEQTAPSVFRVRLERPLAPGARLRIQLDLQGRNRVVTAEETSLGAQGLAGLMAATREDGDTGDHGMLAVGDGIGSFAHFYAVLADRQGDRWVVDDGGVLGDLGTGQIHHVRARVVAPVGVQVVSSGITTGSRPVRDTPGRAPRQEITIESGVIRDFALLASRELESLARTVGQVTVRSWYLPADRAAGRRVLDAAATSLELFERRFGAYPFTELDVVEAPLIGGAGGVEFSSLVTVASMFYHPADASSLGALGALGGGGTNLAEMQTAMLEFVTAHEVAHQWWYGLVGSDARQHPWVDECLAQWSAMHWVEVRYGEERGRAEGERQVAMGYRTMRMLGQPDAPVARPASAFRPPITYAGLVYGKGPYLYRELRETMGDRTFFDGLQAYVRRYRFRTAPARGPIDSLATGRTASRVRALARRWLDERHGDADLGGGDASATIASMIPPELRGQLSDPAAQSMLGEMLRAMMGGMAGGGASLGDLGDLGSLLGGAGLGGLGGLGGAAGGESVSPEQLLQMMREMQGALDALPADASP